MRLWIRYRMNRASGWTARSFDGLSIDQSLTRAHAAQPAVDLGAVINFPAFLFLDREWC